jgi:hypothetical protein
LLLYLILSRPQAKLSVLGIPEYSDQRCYNYNKAVVYCDLSEAAMVEIGGLHNKDTRIVNKMVRLFQRTIRA